jgi:hypothetical protein
MIQPFTPVEQLGEDIAALAMRIHAATYELLIMLRQFDGQQGWGNGFLSCAHWLSWRTGIEMGAAREKVRVANALVILPLLSGALERGEVSYAKVRALTRVATPQNEERLLYLAYHATASQVERIARAWRRCDRMEEAREDQYRHLARSVTTYVDEDGMVVLRARPAPDQGAVIQRALEAAAERLYQESKSAAEPGSLPEEVSFAQRQADAMTLVAECALQSNLDRDSAADRYQVVVHVETASDPHEPVQTMVETNQGPVRVSAETCRRLACDASVVVIQEGPDGSVLDVGRKTRTVPTPIRRALAARDRCCRFPGCTARRCDAHHIEHWADGGPTSLDNLMLLCRRHHTLLHEGGISVDRDALGGLTFKRPDGRVIEVAPRPPIGQPRELPRVASPRALQCWDGTPFDLGYVIDVSWRSRQASKRPNAAPCGSSHATT